MASTTSTHPTYGNGKVCYIEMPSNNLDESMAFYKEVFGWTTRTRGDGSVAFDDGVGEVSGTWILGRKPSVEPGILIYLMVDSAATTVDAIVAHGGKIVQPLGVDAPHITARFSDPADTDWETLVPMVPRSAIISLVFYELARWINPGFIPKSTDVSKELSQGVNMCHTCKIVKPLRSKHCRVCDKCVYRFDHHCPWVGVCVGANNISSYVAFLLFQLIDLFVLLFLLVAVVASTNQGGFEKFGTGVALLLHAEIKVALYNTTTNELLNYTRYPYIDTNGRFHNKFDRGALSNMLEFFTCYMGEKHKWNATVV